MTRSKTAALCLRHLLLINLLVTGLALADAENPDPYATITELQQQAFTSSQLVTAALARIETIDRNGPKVNAMIELNPDALAIAKTLDGQPPLGELYGIPIVLKDNIDTGDKMLTTAGSRALADQPAAKDAFIVGRIRQAGGVVLGKTNLSEWANFRSNQSISGWSGRGGQTRNPYVLDRSPCGSSSGSAVAVAAGLTPLAVGTETDGSIICPASMNGIVGIKPSLGLVSRSGIIPLSHSQDTAGPMARTVADAALLLSVLAAEDSQDPATLGAPQRGLNYRQFLDAEALSGKRIGILASKTGQHAGTDQVFDDALATISQLGAVLVNDVEIATLKDIGDPEYTVLLYDFKHDLNHYLGRRRGLPVANLSDLIAFNRRQASVEMPWFGQDIFLEAQSKGELTDDEYVRALATAKRLAGPEGIDATLEKYHLDAIVAPAYTPAFPIDPVLGDGFILGTSTAAAVSGYPAITVPAGRVHELPVGIVLFAEKWSEPKLISFAYAFEQSHQGWQPPKFIPTLAP
ncbi:amidase [Halioxenophilus sp. WMMB6]|uniref:amidase n=1 Tax=Halioxenophilus sp. WMMB6 TaxID=3073815 RepID=UPI00295EADB6|nr:amidase [Halioxenophilus sp. WMMB6]